MTPAARNLLDLLRPEGASGSAARARALPPHAWEEIVSLALDHGVAPLLHRSLQASGVLAALPEHLRARLDEDRRATAFANLRNCAAFRDIARKLRRRNIPLMALKGLHLAERVYRDISLRPMGDVDILVPQAELGNAVATLQRMEYGPEEDMSSAADAMLELGHAVALGHRSLGTLIELHWTLGEPGYGYEAPVEEIWRTAAKGTLADAEVQLMSPAFMLLHVCAHLACNHTFLLGLRGLCDIAEIVRTCPALDWTVVVDQGRRHGWERGVGAALRLARDHLGAAVPGDVFAALGADTLDSAMLSEAIEHLLSSHEIPGDFATAPNFLAFVERRGIADKLALFWRRVLMPRAELALKYGVPERSPRILFCYAARLRDLVRQYAARAWTIHFSDPQFREAVARHARLALWLAGSR
ncbi:MAG: nucleotidyltransferase family protein [Burkholderiales bacterium]|nr:nucleotidyltransferase family protein [Burkholderiales bacterium]